LLPRAEMKSFDQELVMREAERGRSGLQSYRGRAPRFACEFRVDECHRYSDKSHPQHERKHWEPESHGRATEVHACRLSQGRDEEPR
jgi:hypothetical protein